MTKRAVYDCDSCKQIMAIPSVFLRVAYNGDTDYSVAYHFCKTCADSFGRFLNQKGAR